MIKREEGEKQLTAVPLPKDATGKKYLTKDFLQKHCQANGFYSVPRLNECIHLIALGFRKIEALEEFVNVSTLML